MVSVSKASLESSPRKVFRRLSNDSHDSESTGTHTPSTESSSGREHDKERDRITGRSLRYSTGWIEPLREDDEPGAPWSRSDLPGRRTKSLRFSGSLDPLSEISVDDEREIEEHFRLKGSRKGRRSRVNASPDTKRVIAFKMPTGKSPRSESKSPRETMSPRQLKSQQAFHKLVASGAIPAPSSPTLPERSRHTPLPPPKPLPVILVVGPPACGKSTLLQRLIHGSFQDPAHRIAKLEQTVKFEFAVIAGDDEERRSRSHSTPCSPLAPPKPSSPSRKPARSSFSPSLASLPPLPTDAISEADEDDELDESSHSPRSPSPSTALQLSRLSLSMPAHSTPVTKLARIDVLETQATLRAALSRGLMRKMVLLVCSERDAESTRRLRELYHVVEMTKINPSPPIILVGTRCARPGFEMGCNDNGGGEAVFRDFAESISPSLTLIVDSAVGDSVQTLRERLRLFLD